MASAEATTTITNQDYIKVAFAAITGAFLYKVYCSTTTGTEFLTCVLPATLYDGNGTPQDSVVSVAFSTRPDVRNPTIYQMNDTAVAAAATLGGVVPSVTTSVSVAQNLDIPLVATGGVPMENVFLWDLDEIQGMGRFAYTNTEGARFQGLATMEPLARTDDNLPFLVKTYGTTIDAFEATNCQSRGLRVL
jgi:hypothetical protein